MVDVTSNRSNSCFQQNRCVSVSITNVVGWDWRCCSLVCGVCTWNLVCSCWFSWRRWFSILTKLGMMFLVAHLTSVPWLALRSEWRLKQLRHALASRTMEYLFPLSVTTFQSFALCSPSQKRHVRLVGRWSMGGEIIITRTVLTWSKISISFKIALRKLSICHFLFSFCLARFFLIPLGNFFWMMGARISQYVSVFSPSDPSPLKCVSTES